MKTVSGVTVCLLAGVAMTLLVGEIHSAKLPGWYGTWRKREVDALMKDPAFLQCIESNTGGDMSKAYSVMASCYSFVGRPRFGKRTMEKHEGFLGSPASGFEINSLYERDQQAPQFGGYRPVWDVETYQRK